MSKVPRSKFMLAVFVKRGFTTMESENRKKLKCISTSGQTTVSPTYLFRGRFVEPRASNDGKSTLAEKSMLEFINMHCCRCDYSGGTVLMGAKSDRF